MIAQLPFGLPNSTIEGISAVSNVIVSIISVVLTIFLVWLYRQQKEILKRQTELSESAQSALPRIRMYDIFSWTKLVQFENETGIPVQFPGYPERYASLLVNVSNSGKGFAKDIRAELVIQTPYNVHSCVSPLAHRTNMDQIVFNDEGGVLAPEEDEIQMTTAFWFEKSQLPEDLLETDITIEEILSPSELLWVLSEVDWSPVQIGIFIHYRDETGVQDPIQLLTSEAELTEYGDFEHIYRYGGQPTESVYPVWEFNNNR